MNASPSKTRAIDSTTATIHLAALEAAPHPPISGYLSAKKPFYSIKAREVGRRRQYREHPDLLEGARWREGEPHLWVGADRLDKARDEYGIVHPELYNLDAVAYESLLLGLFIIWTGEGGGGAAQAEPDFFVGFSRDGFHWHRPNREPFVPVSNTQGDWNFGNV